MRHLMLSEDMWTYSAWGVRDNFWGMALCLQKSAYRWTPIHRTVDIHVASYQPRRRGLQIQPGPESGLILNQCRRNMNGRQCALESSSHIQWINAHRLRSQTDVTITIATRTIIVLSWYICLYTSSGTRTHTQQTHAKKAKHVFSEVHISR